MVDVPVVQMLGKSLRDMEQIVASCHRSFEIVEVTASAVPVVVDVPVIKQRRWVSPTVKCLEFSSSWRLGTFQLCNRDGFSVMHWVAVYGGFGGYERAFSRFFRIFRAPPGCPGVERQFFAALDDEEFFFVEGHANWHRTLWTYTFPRFSSFPKQQQQQKQQL